MSERRRSHLRADPTKGRERNPDGTFVSEHDDPAEVAKRPRGNPAWVKGKSANPGGGPRGIAVLREMIAKKTGDGKEIVEFMVTVMRGFLPKEKPQGDSEFLDIPGLPEPEPEVLESADPKLRFAAAEWLGDRYFGRPKQTVELQPGPSEPQRPSTPPLRDLLLVLDERDRNDLERILMNFEQARQEGRLALPEAAETVPETEN